MQRSKHNQLFKSPCSTKVVPLLGPSRSRSIRKRGIRIRKRDIPHHPGGCKNSDLSTTTWSSTGLYRATDMVTHFAEGACMTQTCRKILRVSHDIILFETLRRRCSARYGTYQMQDTTSLMLLQIEAGPRPKKRSCPFAKIQFLHTLLGYARHDVVISSCIFLYASCARRAGGIFARWTR